MLFTQATEAGIQLENVLILSPEQYVKAQIPANQKRIVEWAKDNHVNLSIGIQQKESDFNCTLGIMMDSRVSDSTMSTNKKMLKHLGDELIKFIDDMPDQVEEAAEVAETNKKLNVILNNFYDEVRNLCGNDTAMRVEIYKIRDIDSDELVHMLMKDLKQS